jgi:hypothetical protein
MSYHRTDAHRALRAETIHRWKPWLKSTGPRTAEGKRRSAMRGYKGAVRPTLRAIGRALRGDAVTYRVSAARVSTSP